MNLNKCPLNLKLDIHHVLPRSNFNSFIKEVFAINIGHWELKINHGYHQYSKNLTSKLR